MAAAGVLNKVLRDYMRVFLRSSDKNMSLSLLKGEVRLNNMELNEQVVQHLMHLPPTLELKRVTVGALKIRVPWTNLKHEPIFVSISDVNVIIKEAEELVVLPDMSAVKKILKGNTDSTESRGFIDTLLENVHVQVTNMHLQAHFLKCTQFCEITVDSFDLFSTNSQRRVVDLEVLKQMNAGKREVTIYKEIVLGQITVSLCHTRDSTDHAPVTKPAPLHIMSIAPFNSHVAILRHAKTGRLIEVKLGGSVPTIDVSLDDSSLGIGFHFLAATQWCFSRDTSGAKVAEINIPGLGLELETLSHGENEGEELPTVDADLEDLTPELEIEETDSQDSGLIVSMEANISTMHIKFGALYAEAHGLNAMVASTLDQAITDPTGHSTKKKRKHLLLSISAGLSSFVIKSPQLKVPPLLSTHPEKKFLQIQFVMKGGLAELGIEVAPLEMFVDAQDYALITSPIFQNLAGIVLAPSLSSGSTPTTPLAKHLQKLKKCQMTVNVGDILVKLRCNLSPHTLAVHLKSMCCLVNKPNTQVDPTNPGLPATLSFDALSLGFCDSIERGENASSAPLLLHPISIAVQFEVAPWQLFTKNFNVTLDPTQEIAKGQFDAQISSVILSLHQSSLIALLAILKPHVQILSSTIRKGLTVLASVTATIPHSPPITNSHGPHTSTSVTTAHQNAIPVHPLSLLNLRTQSKFTLGPVKVDISASTTSITEVLDYIGSLSEESLATFKTVQDVTNIFSRQTTDQEEQLCSVLIEETKCTLETSLIPVVPFSFFATCKGIQGRLLSFPGNPVTFHLLPIGGSGSTIGEAIVNKNESMVEISYKGELALSEKRLSARGSVSVSSFQIQASGTVPDKLLLIGEKIKKNREKIKALNPAPDTPLIDIVEQSVELQLENVDLAFHGPKWNPACMTPGSAGPLIHMRLINQPNATLDRLKQAMSEELSLQAKNHQVETDTLQKQLHQTQEAYSNLEQQFVVVKCDLLARLTSEDAKAHKINSLMQENEDLTAKNNALASENRRFLRMLEEQFPSVPMRQMKSIIESLTVVNTEAEQLRKKAESQIVLLKDEIRVKNQAHEDALTLFRARITALESENSTMKTEIKNKDSDLDALKAKISALEREAEYDKERIKTLTEQVLKQQKTAETQAAAASVPSTEPAPSVLIEKSTVSAPLVPQLPPSTTSRPPSTAVPSPISTQPRPSASATSVSTPSQSPADALAKVAQFMLHPQHSQHQQTSNTEHTKPPPAKVNPPPQPAHTVTHTASAAPQPQPQPKPAPSATNSPSHTHLPAIATLPSISQTSLPSVPGTSTTPSMPPGNQPTPHTAAATTAAAAPKTSTTPGPAPPPTATITTTTAPAPPPTPTPTPMPAPSGNKLTSLFPSLPSVPPSSLPSIPHTSHPSSASSHNPNTPGINIELPEQLTDMASASKMKLQEGWGKFKKRMNV
ncbi:hypothetical protein Pelo_11061 [Pelomyxa schiedti]|nr:hypothetical protein Pelo_11061 [Pelomyxa schiedti]